MDAECFTRADVACDKGHEGDDGAADDDGGDGDDGVDEGDDDEVMRSLITGTLATLPLTDRQEMCANHSYVRVRAYFAFSELKILLTLNI